MKYFRNYFLKPLAIIVMGALIFTFIAGTTDVVKWSIWLRLAYIVSLFIAFIVTDFEE